jgi:hypothetical protein
MGGRVRPPAAGPLAARALRCGAHARLERRHVDAFVRRTHVEHERARGAGPCVGAACPISTG